MDVKKNTPGKSHVIHRKASADKMKECTSFMSAANGKPLLKCVMDSSSLGAVEGSPPRVHPWSPVRCDEVGIQIIVCLIVLIAFDLLIY